MEPTAAANMTTLTPARAVHLTSALLAVAMGPFALWSRLGARPRPRLHRALGYAWATLMVLASLSALWVRGDRLPNWGGYTPIHLLVPVTLGALGYALWAVAHGRVAAHRKAMQRLYLGACVVAGAFTLLPGRYLGHLLWHQTLGWGG